MNTSDDWSTLATESVALTLFNDPALLRKARMFIRSTYVTQKKKAALRAFIHDNIKIDDWAKGTQVDIHQLTEALIRYYYYDGKEQFQIKHEDLTMWVAYQLITNDPDWTSLAHCDQRVFESRAAESILKNIKEYAVPTALIFWNQLRGRLRYYAISPRKTFSSPGLPYVFKSHMNHKLIDWVVTDIFYTDERLQRFVNEVMCYAKPIDNLRILLREYCDRILTADELEVLFNKLQSKALLHDLSPDDIEPMRWTDDQSKVKNDPTPRRSELMKKPLYETREFFDGVDLAQMDDEQIIHEIASLEKKADELGKVKTESKRIKEQITALNEAAAKLAAFLDARS